MFILLRNDHSFGNLLDVPTSASVCQRIFHNLQYSTIFSWLIFWQRGLLLRRCSTVSWAQGPWLVQVQAGFEAQEVQMVKVE